MSWLLKLYKTYEDNLSEVGKKYIKYNGQEYTLLPISHTTQTAHIEVKIDENGNFHTAEIIGKNDFDKITLIPTTEVSASRSGSGIEKMPYPLHDKLPFVAGDFVSYGGVIKKEEPFAHYIKQLKSWADSLYSTDTVKIIYKYLSKKTLIKDLVEEKILWLDANQKLISKFDKKMEGYLGFKPSIFSSVTGEQESAFIRFSIYSPDNIMKPPWNDIELYNSYISYYNNFLGMDDLCYVTGKVLPSTEKHANKIRNAGDKAKLISANDDKGFTFKGRFLKATDAANISYEVSQKAHNALKWLINKQGKIIDQRVFLVWGSEVPELTEDTWSLLFGQKINSENYEFKSYTFEHTAQAVSKAIDGYKRYLNPKEDVQILILDSATTGRMAVLYYRSLNKSQYLQKIKEWHLTCTWNHRYRKNENNEVTSFIGAPSLKDIAFAAYGPKANEKVIKGTMERMIPSVIDGRKVPKDIVRSAFKRASNPLSMETWEWEKTLSISCALINKEEKYSVGLDVNNNSRDYLFGRLLAVADVLERNALDASDKRATNARRYMSTFAQHPERTWLTIQKALQPYQARLGEKVWYYNKLIDEIGSMLKPEDFNNKPLTGKYLLGFYSQRHDHYSKKVKESITVEISE